MEWRGGERNVQPWLVGVARLVELLNGTVVASAIGRLGALEADLLNALGAGAGDRAEGGADGGSNADHFG